MKRQPVDKPLLISIVALVVSGLFLFSSASLGLLARNAATYSSVTISHALLGLCLGIVLCVVATHVNYRKIRPLAFYIFLLSIVATALVFIPGLGFEHGGAKRWLDLGFFSFQPSELLKIGFIIYLAAWISSVKNRVSTWRYGTLPFIIMVGICGLLLLSQPDTDTFIILFVTGIAMMLVAGGSWKHVAIMLCVALVGFGALIYTRPYIKDRVMTFINPAEDSLGSSYQIQQSLIAIGSGQVFGRGFGQSIQKFNFLPEPIGDSIFAVAAEEFGFVGSVALIALFLFFAFRGLKISIQAPDTFGGLVACGIVILILSQSFINMGAMLGILPLSGVPLLFVSHGGSALAVTLAEVGILLNISRTAKRSAS